MVIDAARLDAAFLRSLEHPDIKPHVGKAVSRGDLRRRAREAQEEIWEAATEPRMVEDEAREAAKNLEASSASELRNQAKLRRGSFTPGEQVVLESVLHEKWDTLEPKQREVAVAFIPDAAERGASLVPRAVTLLSTILAAITIVSFFTFLILFIVTPGQIGERIAAIKVTLPMQWTLAGFLIGMALTVVAARLGQLLARATRARWSPIAMKVLAELVEISAFMAGRADVANTHVTASAASTDAALDSVMIRILRREVVARTGDDYSTELPRITPSGLAEGFNVRSELITPARARLDHLLQSMPNGSIGIAGSRGAGKSTLLKTFAVKQFLRRTTDSGEEEQVPLVSVEVSAPVDYDVRDFVMHVFQMLCMNVRKTIGDTGDPRTPADPRPQGFRRFEPMLVDLATNLMWVCGVVSAILIAVAAYVAIDASTLSSLQIKPFDVALTAMGWAIAAYLLRFATERYSSDRKFEAWAKTPAADDPPQPSVPSSFPGSPEEWELLRMRARDNLVLLRYQRNFAADWSAGAKFAGFEAGVKQGQTWQEQRLTLPEIVALYREFVEVVARHFVVLIAIDEMDKMSTDEKAHNFLNDVKALFGITNCFYLITVSDNAMSTFARRGLPIRDAFDSALDEVVRVEHMDLATAQELLSGRVIGLPLPFLTFCYCFSAGLPRDLIRACRDVFEHSEGTKTRQLGEIGRSIFRDDLVSKIQGTISAITQAQKSGKGSVIVDRLWLLLDDIEKKLDFVDDYSDLIAGAGDSKTDPQVAALAVDLASYLYYTLTVLELIDKQGDAQKSWDGAREAKLFEELARLRRYIGVDSVAAGLAIGNLRRSQKLRVPQAPAPQPHADA